MKRFFLIATLVSALSACTAATVASVSPAATPTATQTPPVDLETNSIMPGVGLATGAAETPPPQEIGVLIYFTADNDAEMTPMPVTRTIPNSDDFTLIVRSTLEELLKGPTDAEKTQGLISWFSAATACSLTSVAFHDDILGVDFAGWKTIIPNASTSAGSQMLLSQLNSTLFQFPSVQRVDYTLDGDCAVFWEWLQSECHSVTRSDWEKG